MRNVALEKTLEIDSTDDDYINEIKIIDKIEKGFPFSIIKKLIDENKLCHQEVIEIILPNRTFYRRKKEGHLNIEESDKVAALINLIEFAEETFANENKAHKWLRRPNKSLDNKKPIEFLKTTFGLKMIESLLYKIAYGIY